MNQWLIALILAVFVVIGLPLMTFMVCFTFSWIARVFGKPVSIVLALIAVFTVIFYGLLGVSQ